MRCHVFGLTGGIGTGKTTVANRWRARHLPVFDADELARAAVQPHSSGLAAVVAEFGTEVLGPDGALDRAKIARIVFHDLSARKRLEAIVHPFVHSTLEVEIADSSCARSPWLATKLPSSSRRGRQIDIVPS
ncbi:MAG: dephospho-CoA kinase [Polyangiaceae bacterium]